MKMIKSYIYTFILMAISFSVNAQENNKSKEEGDKKLGSEVINVVKAYSPEVSDAYKIMVSPEERNEDTNVEKQNYQTFSTDVVSTYKPSKISSKKQAKQKLEKPFNNFAKFAFGNYTTPYLELYMNNKKVKNQRYGVHVKHLSSQGGIEGVKLNDAFVNSSIDGFYWKQFKNYQLKTNLEYNYQSINWYGVPEVFNTEDIAKDVNIGQYYQTIQADASLINNVKRNTSVFKSTDFSAYRMWDRYGSYENRVVLGGDFSIPVEDNSIKLKVDLDYINNGFNQSYADMTSIKNSYLNISAAPSYEIIKDNISLNIGVIFAYSADLEGDNNQFRVLPDITASVNIIDDLMIVYGGLEGELKQNSLQQIVSEMPYISPTQTISPSTKQYNAYVGLKGKLLSNLSYNTSIGFSKENGFIHYSKNPYILTPNSVDGWGYNNSFSALQDTVSVVTFNAGLDYNPIKNLMIGAELEYNNYSSKNYEYVYNKPNVKVTITGEYSFLEDFKVGTSMYYVGKRYYSNYVTTFGPDIFAPVPSPKFETGGELDAFFDLNFSASYDITKQFSAFVMFNNVLNQNYELYKDYPLQAFQVMGGVTYKF